MTTKAKDGRETLQERLRRSTARMANECSVRLDLWCEHSSVCLQLANDHDAAQAEIARLKDQVELAWHEHSVAVARIPLPVAEDVVECDESNSFVKPKSSKRYKLVPVDQPEAAPEGLIRNAALQEAAAHLRDMGYWTQASAVLSLCTNASAPTPASAQDLVKALEQIRVVCLDNTASERPDLALKFVSEVAEKALSATGGVK